MATRIRGVKWITVLSVIFVAASLTFGCVLLLGGIDGAATIPNLYPFQNSTGKVATYTPNGAIDLTNPFFQSLGSNGRACVTCYQPDQAWRIAGDGVQAGLD